MWRHSITVGERSIPWLERRGAMYFGGFCQHQGNSVKLVVDSNSKWPFTPTLSRGIIQSRRVLHCAG